MLKKVVCAVALLCASTGYAKVLDLTAGKVEWKATGNPGFIHIDGKGGNLNAHVEIDAGGKATGIFSVKMADFNTGLDLRDEHMKTKYLEVNKFPTAMFTLDPWPVTAAPSPFTGNLEIKNQKHAVSGTAAVDTDGRLHVEFKVNLDDYPAIGVPSWAGVSMAKSVDVTVDASGVHP